MCSIFHLPLNNSFFSFPCLLSCAMTVNNKNKQWEKTKSARKNFRCLFVQRPRRPTFTIFFSLLLSFYFCVVKFTKKICLFMLMTFLWLSYKCTNGNCENISSFSLSLWLSPQQHYRSTFFKFPLFRSYLTRI